MSLETAAWALGRLQSPIKERMDREGILLKIGLCSFSFGRLTDCTPYVWTVSVRVRGILPGITLLGLTYNMLSVFQCHTY